MRVIKMNILFIANCASAYGANQSMLDLILSLRRKGNKAYVMLPCDGLYVGMLEKNQIPYVIKPFKVCAHHINELDGKDKLLMFSNNLSLLHDMKEYVKEWKIEIIHTNASNIDIGAMLAKYCKIPHIWHLRELLKESYQLYYDFPKLDNYLLLKSDGIICISEYLKSAKGVSGDNVHVLGDGMDIGKYALNKKELFREGSDLEILFAGYITEVKGVIDAVRAVDILVNKYKMKVHLTLAGDAAPLLDRIKKYIKYRGLEGIIEHVGYQKDLMPFREKADIALMCSRSEALGRVTIESMLGELLVIGAAAGATKEIVRDGVTGYLYEPGNVVQLSQVIWKAVEQKERSRTIVKQAKQYAINQFDSDRYAQRVIEIYKTTLKDKMV